MTETTTETTTQTGTEQQHIVSYYQQPQSEWESAFVAYRAAQSRLAFAAAFMAAQAWTEMVRASAFAATLPRWLDYVVRIVRAFRAHQRRLAQSFYQYGRAREISETYGPPLSGDDTSLGGYRAAFLDQLQDVALLETEAPSDWDAEDGMDEVREELRELLAEQDAAEDEERSQREANFRAVNLDRAIQQFLSAYEENGDREVDVLDVSWPDRDADDADQRHREFFREIAEELWQDQQDDMDRDEALEDDEDDEDETMSRRDRMLARIEEATDQVGNQVAGQVMQATSHAADTVTNWAMDRDERVYGVARGTGPNPCVLCALAASRGFVYKSVATAMTTRAGGAFKRYHRNCQCYPIIRWNPSQEEPETTKRWSSLYQQAKQQPGNTFNNFRRILYERDAANINARRRRWYAQNKNRINARRRARRRSGR
jgi:hypothetical protein